MTDRSSAATSAIVGIDENGLGPRLGPLLVTSALALCESGKAAKRASSTPSKSLAAWIGDSKKLIGFSDTKLGEAWARVLYREERGEDPKSIDDIVNLVCLDSFRERTKLCPNVSSPTHLSSSRVSTTSLRIQCWHTRDGDWLAEEELVAGVSKIRHKLMREGFSTIRIRSVAACTKVINLAADAGRSRLLVDLHAMERLLLDAHQFSQTDLDATCGKVGGYGAYGEHFQLLAPYLRSTVIESRARSTYHFPALGSVSFVRDADAHHLLVSLSSLVGKWLRDTLMKRIVSFYQDSNPKLASVSGYNDPVTDRFVRLTRSHRKAIQVPNDCFERRKMGSLK